MSKVMRAYRIPAWGADPSPHETVVPEPGPGEILVRVGGCGLCHSDFVMRNMPQQIGESLGWSMPFTLGHETAGWIAGLGAGVTGFAEGDAVALLATASCGECWYCLRALDNCCPQATVGRGYGRDGGLADYVLVTGKRSLLRLGTLDPREAGPLTDAGATAYHAVRRLLPRVHPGGTVVVLGAGGLGAFAIQLLRALTAAQVIAVDPQPSRLDRAKTLGAHHTLAGVPSGDPRDFRRELRELVGPLGADGVLDFVGADATISTGLKALRPGGAFGLVGAAGGKLDKPWFGGLPADGEVFTFQGSTAADAQEMIALAAGGLVRNDVDRFGFDEIDQAYARLHEGSLTGRAVIVLTG